MNRFHKGDYVSFTAREGHDCRLYVNNIMEQYLRGKIFRVKSVAGYDLEIEVCDLTENPHVTAQHMGWGYTADMFSLYEESDCKMDFTYEQLLTGGGDEK